MTAADGADRAQEMLPVAAHLAVLVHGEGGPQDVQAVLDGLDEAQRTALIVVLAGLVDPDQPLGAGFLGPGDSGGDGGRLRDAAQEPDPGEGDFVDLVAVDAYLAGRRVQVTPQERMEAIVRGVRRGMTYPQFDAAHGLTRGSTSSFVSRLRRRYARLGRPFPVLEHSAGVQVFTAEQVIEIRERAAAGASDGKLAVEYGVHRYTIDSIVSGRTYARVGGPVRALSEPGPAVAAERDLMVMAS